MGIMPSKPQIPVMPEPLRPRRGEGQKPKERCLSEPRISPLDKTGQSWAWESPTDADWKSGKGGAERWSRYEKEGSITTPGDMSKDEELNAAVKAGMLGFILVLCLVMTMFLMNLPRPPAARETATPDANLTTVALI